MATRSNSDDRRQRDASPPAGWKDRRREVERRHIAVIEISQQEWRLAWTQRREPGEPSLSYDNPR